MRVSNVLSSSNYDSSCLLFLCIMLQSAPRQHPAPIFGRCQYATKATFASTFLLKQIINKRVRLRFPFNQIFSLVTFFLQFQRTNVAIAHWQNGWHTSDSYPVIKKPLIYIWGLVRIFEEMRAQTRNFSLPAAHNGFDSSIVTLHIFP